MAAALFAALFQQAVIPVRGTGVQHAVLPVRGRRHQFFPERDPGVDQPLPGLVDVGDAELPGQDLVWAATAEPGPALDAEFESSMSERCEIRVLGALVGNVEAQPDVEVTFGREIADE